MKPLLKNPLTNLILGGAVGAILVGCVWGGTYYFQGHDGVIAKVGDTAIKKSDFQTKLESSSGDSTLNQLVTNQLITDAAQKYHITASAQDVDTALQNLEQQNNITSDAQLQAVLTANHLTLDDVKKNLQIEVLSEKLAERNVTVTDKDIQDYYNQNKSEFTTSGKTAPLSDVKTQIESAIKQSKAIPSDQLLANLAKEDPIQIMDTQYSDVKTNIENPTSSSSAAGAAGATP